MSEKADGGPAFPQIETDERVSDCDSQVFGDTHSYGGMSLRDWFAGMALQGLLAMCVGKEFVAGYEKQASREAYGIADAMIAEREK